jgi:hypothetical protein
MDGVIILKNMLTDTQFGGRLIEVAARTGDERPFEGVFLRRWSMARLADRGYEAA